MAEIHNLKELNELGRDLKLDDNIHFKAENIKLTYTISETFVGIFQANRYNSTIFKYLGLNTTERYELANKCYGYSSRSGGWPTFTRYDYKAAERLIREIYKLLKDDSEVIDPKDRIMSRFDILDIR